MSKAAKILLVDDEPDTLSLVHRILDAEGFQVIEAVDGQEALDKYASERPDLILLDIIIPQVDGTQVLKNIRQHDQVTGIIMVSALNSERLMIECMQAGADEYVSKPFQLKEMRSRIKQVLEKTELRQRNAELQRQVDELNARMRILLQRYMPQRVTERLLREPGTPQLGGVRQEVSVMFVDLRNFSAMAEMVPPDRLVQVLNAHLSAIAETALRFEGTLDKFLGDGAMVLFNAPVPQPDHVLRAVCCALEVQQVLTHLSVLPSGQRLQISIGIHTGEAVVGNIGSRELMNYTAVGDTVVVAKRLQEQAEPDQVLVSEEVYRRVEDEVLAEEVGLLNVKGRQEPVHAYRLLGLRANVVPSQVVPVRGQNQLA